MFRHAAPEGRVGQGGQGGLALKLAVLANRENSFVLPMAQGLRRMLSRLGVGTDIFYSGLRMLWATEIRRSSAGTRLTTSLKKGLKDLALAPYLAQLRKYNAVVVINNIPGAFFSNFRVEAIRRFAPGVPIVNYDLHYLPTQGEMSRWLREGNPQKGIPFGGNAGLDRYDWYLMVSVTSETPLPQGRHPYSLIGLNLDDGTLYPEPGKKFVALLDFPRGNQRERNIQIEALKATGTEFLALAGPAASSGGRAPYSISEIRRIYRRTGAYFLAARESFGLPIAELQACGAFVFTPHADWCPAHWIKPDLSNPGPGELSPNFIVYDNDRERLVAELSRIKTLYAPSKVVETFLRFHPQLYRGDLGELERFVQMIRDGVIHSDLHTMHAEAQGNRGDERRSEAVPAVRWDA